MTMQSDYALSRFQMMKAQSRIIVALMLHDIRSRMGGNALGFLMMGVGWPLSHILLLILINSLIGRAAPFGESAALWFATGVVPFMAFSYMSRFIALGLLLNRPLLYFPVVKITDIVFARAIVELLNAGLVIIILAVLLWAFGIDAIPVDVVQASLALLSMMLLGVGFGVINAIVVRAFPLWFTGYTLLMMVFWIVSGVLFVPSALPAAVRMPLSYLPTLQGVVWMRAAYFVGYGSDILDKTYLVGFGAASLCFGLVLERILRGKLLQ
jgi:capsular polysaccharide transport system permease protein